MDKDKQPGISFDNIMLVKENFWRDHIIPQESRADLKIGANRFNKDNTYITELTATLRLISAEKEVLKLESTFVGVFSVIEGQKNMDLEDYMKNNSSALMFPYIREHITSITQKSGIKPVLLPPLNIVALIKQHGQA